MKNKAYPRTGSGVAELFDLHLHRKAMSLH